MNDRTYGTVKWGRRDDARRSPAFQIEAEPHVMLRLRRWFASANNYSAPVIVLSDTPDNARDLEAFLVRFPMEVDEAAAGALAASAGAHRDRESSLLEVLRGTRRTEFPADLQPARPLYDYQDEAREFFWVGRRGVLGDGVAMGKTASALGMFSNPDCLPAVFVTLTDLPGQMMREASEVLPWLTGYVTTKGSYYDPTRKRKGPQSWPDVLYTSYSKLPGWVGHLRSIGIRTVIFDEGQELRRDTSSRYSAAKALADSAEYVVALTATPVYNYGGEMYNLMQVVAPGRLGTREEFQREWGAGYGSGTGMGSLKVKDPKGLGSYLRDQGLMLARTRKDVGRELPPVAHVQQEVDSDTAALDAIGDELADLAALLFDRATGKGQRLSASSELDWRLRQQTGIAKAPWVARFAEVLLESEDKIVVYAWHRAVYDILLAKLRDYRPVMFTGSESAAQKRATLDAFATPTARGGARVLLISLRAGAGLDGLQDHAEVCVFAELDWSPQRHRQAAGRLDRPRKDGQRNNVVAYYLYTEDGSDPFLMEKLDVKRLQNDPMVDPNTEVDVAGVTEGNRVRSLAEAVLKRAGRALPVADEQPADPAAAFAAFQTDDETTPQGQMGLFDDA